MWNRITQALVRTDCDLRERMFRTIIFMSGIATVVGIAECFLVMEIDNVLLPCLLFLLAVMGGSLFATFKYRRLDLAAGLVGFVVIVLVFPLLVCLSGGIDSGATVWMALGILYIFIMFTGKKLVSFLLLCFLTYGGTYAVIYFFPEVVVPMPSRAAVHIDSFFSVIVVGITAGIILKVHMKVFEEEHMLTIAQKEELEQSSNSKNIFFANMSHEIRSPINTIIGLNELILRVNPTGETREYALDIQLASKMLLNQVNDILDLSQMEMKKMKILPMEYRTGEMFGDLVELIRVQAEKKGLELHVDIDKNLPSILYGDEKRLKQVVLNILDNAVKYTREGAVTLSAEGEETGENELILKIKVADTGIGIRKEDVEYIYDSFNRTDERRNVRIEGSGLGLAITKQLVDMMGGEITVDSIYTKGTVFTVMIRQRIVNSAPVGNVEFLKREKEGERYYQPSFEAPEARILIVDDNKMNSLVTGRLLLSTKVQIDVANSGAECLEMTQKKFYHVILMDDMMPEMNGRETLKALRAQETGLCREAAVIAMTANALSGAAGMYLEQGFDGYVEKPVQGKSLEAEILRFLPQDIIEYQEDTTNEEISQIQRISQKKRKKIYITSECTCDIPTEWLDKYDIKLLYLYIRTPHGRFADTKELGSDSLTQFLTPEKSSAYADSMTVEEYEEFFAETLTQAERVIHISIASGIGKSYETAVEAAQGFDHVRVIDSGQLSGGQGLMTLYAAKLAMEGQSAEEICKALEKVKGNIQTRFIMPGADILYQNGRTRAVTAKACRTFRLHPILVMRQNRVAVTGLLGGSIENAWKQGIYWHLRHRRKINRDIVVITHVGCSVRQREWIQKEIAKYVSFDRVIVQKASFTNACNSGLEAIGISYYTGLKK